MSFVADYILDKWEGLLNDKRPGRIDLAKIHSRPDPKSSVTFFVFIDGARQPQYVLKMNREAFYGHAIKSEYDNFCSIYNRLSEARNSVPMPVFLREIDHGHLVFCQTALNGKKATYDFFAKRDCGSKRMFMDRFARSSFEWLGRFHGETLKRYQIVDEIFVGEYVTKRISKFVNRLESTDNQAILKKMNTAADLIKLHINEKFPIAAVHGDFTHFNILLDDSGINVVDWEDCVAEGLPFEDIYFFMAQLGLNFYPGLREAESFRQFFRIGTWTRMIMDAAIAAYSKKMGIDAALIYGMFPFFLLEFAQREFKPHRNPLCYLFRNQEIFESALDISLTVRKDIR